MDINAISTLLSTFAFPVVACVAMGWFVKYQMDTDKAEMAKLRDEHSAEMEKVTSALNNNTVALEKLCVMISEREG